LESMRAFISMQKYEVSKRRNIADVVLEVNCGAVSTGEQ